MQIFTYSLFFKLLYRFGNIPVTLVLLFYLFPAVLNVDRNNWYLIPVVLLLFLIYYTNKRYLYLYKVIPYKITADSEKLYCTDFLFSKKEVVIFYPDIESLKGGIFDGKLNGLMQVYDGRNKISIGFYPKIRGAKELQTIILSRVKKPVYDEVIERITSKNKRGSK
ncbi:MAG: hypothetical protein R6W90_03165 [Ignavibacteriaceae bacterium]